MRALLLSLALVLVAATGISGARVDFGPVEPRRSEPAPTFTGPVLLVVHASTEFDEKQSARAGIDAQVREFKHRGLPVVYLMHDVTRAGQGAWYTTDRRPDYMVFSEGGEHNLKIATSEVTIVGGYIFSYDGARGCHTLASRDAILGFFEQRSSALTSRGLTIRMPIQAIYFYSDDEVVREEILDPRVPTSSWAESFAHSFFTDNYSDSEDNRQFGHPYDFGSVAHRKYNKNKTNRYRGSVYESDFKFSFELGTQVVQTRGTGKNLVKIKIVR